MATCLKDKQVLVTGAGGFIGSHLVERLVQEDARVRAFVRYNSRGDLGMLRLAAPEALANIEVVAGDLRDQAAVLDATQGCQLVFHLGALVSIPYSYLHPFEVAETNLIGTLNVLMACRLAAVERLIHTSSSEVYGTAQRIPISETHPLHGQSPYSATKIGADKLVESFSCTYELPAVTVRPFNTYGPRQSSRAVIPTIVTQALVNQTIRLGNVAATRDFTYVDDTVSGFLCAATADEVEGRTFNLGTGEEISIGDLAEKISRKAGCPAHVVVDPIRLRPEASEVMRLVSDHAEARHWLSWIPRVRLEEGLDRTIMWIRENLGLYQVGVYEF